MATHLEQPLGRGEVQRAARVVVSGVDVGAVLGHEPPETHRVAGVRGGAQVGREVGVADARRRAALGAIGFEKDDGGVVRRAGGVRRADRVVERRALTERARECCGTCVLADGDC